MKIYHIDRQKSWTGQTNRILQVATGIQQHGHDVGVITQPGSQLAARARDAGLEVVLCNMRGWRFNLTVVQLALLLRTKRVDVLHCHGARDNLLALISGRAGRVRHVVRTKHNHTALKSGCWSRSVYNGCSRVITVSDYIRRHLIQDGIDPGHVETIHTCINLSNFTPRSTDMNLARQYNIQPDEVVVGCVSSLHARKGIEDLLDAVKIVVEKNPTCRLKCMLVGKKWRRWMEKATGMGISDRLVCTGFHKNVADCLALFTMYVLPSREEGLGTSILEAMAMGLPVITTEVGGIPEAVTPDTGILVPPHSPAPLADAIQSIIDDRTRAGMLGLAARQRVLKKFSHERLIEHTQVLYSALA